ncbi:MAG: glycosyltransferase [bacterium]|nr:glycosyltransferase [bacterium]
MNILMLSTDRSAFDDDSSMRRRLAEQGSLVSALHVIVLTKKEEPFKLLHFGRRVTVHPTLSTSRLTYVVDAYRLGVEILKAHNKGQKWLITTQDPFELGAVGYMLARKFRIPLHVQVHTDPWSDTWRNGHSWNRLRYLLSLFLLQRADGIRVVSERVKRRVLSLGIPKERVTKIPIYVDTAHFFQAKPAFDLRATYPLFKKIVLSIGRLEPEKNFRGLIRAFSTVHQAHADALLIIIGSGKERERLLSLARSLSLEECVKILPWARDVATYYKTCDMYVQPSFYEGWGLAVIEAMASGTPVVMTDVGCAGEVVLSERTGLVVPVADEKALARAILRLLENRELALSLAANGNMAIKKLATKAETLMLYKTSWEKAVKQSQVTSNKSQVNANVFP